MKELKEMGPEELIEIIRIKDAMIRELKEEIEIYRQLVSQLQEKNGGQYPSSR